MSRHGLRRWLRPDIAGEGLVWAKVSPKTKDKKRAKLICLPMAAKRMKCPREALSFMWFSLVNQLCGNLQAHNWIMQIQNWPSSVFSFCTCRSDLFAKSLFAVTMLILWCSEWDCFEKLRRNFQSISQNTKLSKFGTSFFIMPCSDVYANWEGKNANTV